MIDLHYCSSLFDPSVFNALLCKIGKTHLRIKNAQGNTPISLAVIEGNTSMLTKILEYDQSLKVYANPINGNSLLHLAYNKLDIAKELIKCGLNVEDKNNEGLTVANLISTISDIQLKTSMCEILGDSKQNVVPSCFEKIIVHLDMSSCQLKLQYIEQFLKTMNNLSIHDILLDTGSCMSMGIYSVDEKKSIHLLLKKYQMGVIVYMNCMCKLEYILNDMAYINLREQLGNESVICISNSDSILAVEKYIIRMIDEFPEATTLCLGTLPTELMSLCCSCPNCRIQLQEVTKEAMIVQYLLKLISKVLKLRPNILIILEESIIDLSSLQKTFKNTVIATKSTPFHEKYAIFNATSYMNGCYCNICSTIQETAKLIKALSIDKANGVIIISSNRSSSDAVINSLPPCILFPLYAIISTLQANDADAMRLYQALNAISMDSLLPTAIPLKLKNDDYCRNCYDISYYLSQYEQSIDEVENNIKNQNILYYKALLGSKVVTSIADSRKIQKLLHAIESLLYKIEPIFYEEFSQYVLPTTINEFKNRYIERAHYKIQNIISLFNVETHLPIKSYAERTTQTVGDTFEEPTLVKRHSKKSKKEELKTPIDLEPLKNIKKRICNDSSDDDPITYYK